MLAMLATHRQPYRSQDTHDQIHDGRTGQGHPARLDSGGRRLAGRQGFHQFGNLGLVVRWTCHYRSDSVELVQEQAATWLKVPNHSLKKILP